MDLWWHATKRGRSTLRYDIDISIDTKTSAYSYTSAIRSQHGTHCTTQDFEILRSGDVEIWDGDEDSCRYIGGRDRRRRSNGNDNGNGNGHGNGDGTRKRASASAPPTALSMANALVIAAGGKTITCEGDREDGTMARWTYGSAKRSMQVCSFNELNRRRRRQTKDENKINRAGRILRTISLPSPHPHDPASQTDRKTTDRQTGPHLESWLVRHVHEDLPLHHGPGHGGGVQWRFHSSG